MKINPVLSNVLCKKRFASPSKSLHCWDYEHTMAQLTFPRVLGIELQSSGLCIWPLTELPPLKFSGWYYQSLKYKGNSAWCLWFVICLSLIILFLLHCELNEDNWPQIQILEHISSCSETRRYLLLSEIRVIVSHKHRFRLFNLACSSLEAATQSFHDPRTKYSQKSKNFPNSTLGRGAAANKKVCAAHFGGHLLASGLVDTDGLVLSLQML